MAIGELVLNDNIIGSNNTAVGFPARRQNLGSDNVFIGGDAVNTASASGSNELFIGNSTAGPENNYK